MLGKNSDGQIGNGLYGFGVNQLTPTLVDLGMVELHNQ